MDLFSNVNWKMNLLRMQVFADGQSSWHPPAGRLNSYNIQLTPISKKATTFSNHCLLVSCHHIFFFKLHIIFFCVMFWVNTNFSPIHLKRFAQNMMWHNKTNIYNVGMFALNLCPENPKKWD